MSKIGSTNRHLNLMANRVLAIKLIAAATTYGFSIFAARIMSPGGFGQVAVFLSAAMFLSVLGAQGQQMAALRFIPLLRNQTGQAQAFAAWSFRRAAAGTTGIFAFGILASQFALMLFPQSGYTGTTVLLGLVLIPLVGWVDFQSNVARAFDRLELSLWPKEILWRGISGLTICAVWLYHGQDRVSPGLVIGILVATLFLIAAGQAWTLFTRNKFSLLAKPQIVDPEWRKSSASFWISSVSNIFLANADVIVVGVLVGPAAAGYYFAANRLAMLLGFFQTSHNVVLGPELARVWAHQGRAESARIIQSAALRMTLPTLCLGALLFFAAPQFLALFGPGFSAATTPLRLLIIAGLINSALGPGDIALNMCGFHRQAMIANVWLLCANLLVLGLGAVLAGAIGVAGAVLAATILRKTCFWWLTLRLMAIRSDAFYFDYQTMFRQMVSR